MERVRGLCWGMKEHVLRAGAYRDSVCRVLQVATVLRLRAIALDSRSWTGAAQGSHQPVRQLAR